jgi:hypothetical protein
MAARCRSELWCLAISIAWLGALAASGEAHADDTGLSPRGTLEVPPPPGAGAPWWELELGALAVVPIERSAICPGNRDCVMNAGIGLGTRLTQRTPDGLGWGLAYDLWVLDSASVYEVALLHALRGHIRYVIDDTSRLQPWVGGSAGVLLFGDASTVATGGGLVSASGGAHLELTSEFAIVASAEVWVLATAPFSTRDGTRRADPFSVNVVAEIMLGAVVRIGALDRDEARRGA